MANNAQKLLTFVLAPSGQAGSSFDVDINLGQEGVKFFVYGIDVTYAATGNPTGVTTNVFVGHGNNDPLALIGVAPNFFALPVVPGGSLVPDYGSNPYPVIMSPLLASHGTPQGVNTQGYLNGVEIAYAGWAKFRFQNTDLTNSATVTFRATI